MSIQKRGDGSWRVRWTEGKSWRSRTFALKGDAQAFENEMYRHRRLGTLATLDAGRETLNEYVENTWGPTYAALLAPKTRQTYTVLYTGHLGRTFGKIPLRELNSEMIARWQSDRLADGAGPVAVHQALGLLGNICQRACEAGRIPSNPTRNVRKARLPRRAETRPLAPSTVEAMRTASTPRDAMLIGLMAYGGLRPGEALGLQWGDVRDRTLLVQRSLSLGREKGTKTNTSRTVRLLSPLAADLREWKMLSGRPKDRALIIPAKDGGPWSEQAYMSWRRQAFARAVQTAGLDRARPYDLRHSYASLLLSEGRSVIYVARQLGHGAQLTLSTYGHVIDELEDQARQEADAVILAARETYAAHFLPIAAQ